MVTRRFNTISDKDEFKKLVETQQEEAFALEGDLQERKSKAVKSTLIGVHRKIPFPYSSRLLFILLDRSSHVVKEKESPTCQSETESFGGKI